MIVRIETKLEYIIKGVHEIKAEVKEKSKVATKSIKPAHAMTYGQKVL